MNLLIIIFHVVSWLNEYVNLKYQSDRLKLVTLTQ